MQSPARGTKLDVPQSPLLMPWVQSEILHLRLQKTTASTELFGGLSRGSRHGRASVIYAEPSLWDEMRRPTKDLVDAVSARETLRLRQTLARHSGKRERHSEYGGDLETRLDAMDIECRREEESQIIW